MHSRFDRFRKTRLGIQLEAVLADPLRYVEFAALARAKVPSIVAISHELGEKFPELTDDTTARQFCGAMVADVMRSHGHDVVQARGRAGGELFTYGAVFSPLPLQRSFTHLVQALERFPAQLASVVESLPKPQWTTRPAGSGFALVEHVCHLRDLDSVYGARTRAVLTRDLPSLTSVDGAAWAAQRGYLKAALVPALASFRRLRGRLCLRLKATTGAERKRCGLRDGLRRMSLEDLVREMAEHDQTHALELDELLNELRP
ncbi:MAG TPA: DinB family protein [Burkholderiaceae bacterium]|nr:DinB family protein [Burkholderiaceae bacterium]